MSRGTTVFSIAAPIIVFALWLPWSRSVRRIEPEPRPRIDFAKQIRPIVSARCQPCHFPGGSMHAELPFDQEATIRKLGTRLFSRIRDEKERAMIRAFLEQK